MLDRALNMLLHVPGFPILEMNKWNEQSMLEETQKNGNKHVLFGSCSKNVLNLQENILVELFFKFDKMIQLSNLIFK